MRCVQWLHPHPGGLAGSWPGAAMTTIVINGREHAHTASMRLRNAADLIVSDPTLLGDDVAREHQLRIAAELRRVAAEIGEGG